MLAIDLFATFLNNVLGTDETFQQPINPKNKTEWQWVVQVGKLICVRLFDVEKL